MSGTEPVRFFLPVQSYRRMSMFDSPAHVGLLRGSVDFLCPEGTKVFAAAPGRVIDVKDDSDLGGDEQSAEGWGNFVEIQHADGSVSEYEHLQKGSACVRIGDDVLPSNQIARSGATGWLGGLGPHLHFMVGRYTAPMVFEAQEIQWAIETPPGPEPSPGSLSSVASVTGNGAGPSLQKDAGSSPAAAEDPFPAVPTERPTLTEAWVDSVSIAGLRKLLEQRNAALAESERAKQDAYTDRNLLVVAFARLIRESYGRGSVWTGETEDPDFPAVYIGLHPVGQVSWHLPRKLIDELRVGSDIPHGKGSWDGHDTPEKRRRLEAWRP